ncbi:hypothetical protein M513_05904 [Trichuris suis]|uniref:Uncharacterized protein n=1 Tax=Trichuris suis TaxID=68888 RepID=A0A085M7J8_9BILA|nr:hypothetical protein M513_05904 [Trichuris suis]
MSLNATQRICHIKNYVFEYTAKAELPRKQTLSEALRALDTRKDAQGKEKFRVKQDDGERARLVSELWEKKEKHARDSKSWATKPKLKKLEQLRRHYDHRYPKIEKRNLALYETHSENGLLINNKKEENVGHLHSLRRDKQHQAAAAVRWVGDRVEHSKSVIYENNSSVKVIIFNILNILI